MKQNLSGTSLGDYGKKIYKKYHYTCVYCGFDGRSFDNWMQLSIDHIRPKNCGGTDESNNFVVACRACNSITSRMKFDNNLSNSQILKQKRDKVKERRTIFYQLWIDEVAPNYLNKTLPNIK